MTIYLDKFIKLAVLLVFIQVQTGCHNKRNSKPTCIEPCHRYSLNSIKPLPDDRTLKKSEAETLHTDKTMPLQNIVINETMTENQRPAGHQSTYTKKVSGYSDLDQNNNYHLTVAMDTLINQTNMSHFVMSGSCHPENSTVSINYLQTEHHIPCKHNQWQSIIDLSDEADDTIKFWFYLLNDKNEIKDNTTINVLKDTVLPQLFNISMPATFSRAMGITTLSGECSEGDSVHVSAFGVDYTTKCFAASWQLPVFVPDYQGDNALITISAINTRKNMSHYNFSVPYCRNNKAPEKNDTQTILTNLNRYNDYDIVSFEQTHVPTDWQSKNGALSLSTDHFKHGNRSLRWDWRCHDRLSVHNIQSMGLVPEQVNHFYFHNFRLWVYNLNALPGQKMRLTFWAKGKPEYFYDMHLDFTGWRSAMLSYKYDMDGTKTTGDIDTMTIDTPPLNVGTLFLDFIDFTTDRLIGSSSDHQRLINWGNTNNSFYYNQYNKFIKAEPVQSNEQHSIDLINDRYWPMVKKPKPTDGAIQTALNRFSQLTIIETKDYIKGEPIFTNGYHHPGTNYHDALNNLTTFIPAYRATGDPLYLNNSILLLKHVMDQGFAFGSSFETTPVLGYLLDNFINEILLIKPELQQAGIWEPVFAMLQWYGLLNSLWSTTTVSDMDYANTYLFEILGMILSFDDPVKKHQYLRAYVHTVDLWLTLQGRSGSGLKPDFSTFHHNTHYPGYSYAALNAMASIIQVLDNTVYSIATEKRLVLDNLLKASMINHANEHVPLSLAGRNPFRVNSLSSTMSLIATVQTDSNWPAIANYLYKQQDLQPALKTPLTGFWQFNYRPMGVYRQHDWVMNIKGFNEDFWGSEIYPNSNRYGRYQSYGSVQVHYRLKGNSGYTSQGWDWRFIPGTTSQWLAYQELQAKKSRQDERTQSQFSGALRFEQKPVAFINHELEGTTGLYGMDFQQQAISASHDSGFGFKKSYFAIDDKLLCLGSDINSQDSQTDIVTTVFQSSRNADNPLFINGATVPFRSEFSINQPESLLIDPYGTGYIIKNNDKPLQVFYDSQTAPDQSGSTSHTGDFARVWINHGKQPVDGHYHYWILPDTTPAELTQASTTLSDNAYQIKQQDGHAHIVSFPAKGLTAYVIFSANQRIDNTWIAASSHPLLAMTKENPDTLEITVVNPDIRFENTLALPTDIVLTLKGTWHDPTGELAIQTIDQETEIRLQSTHGEPIDLKLQKHQGANNQ